MNVDQAPRRRLWRMVYRSRCARHITKQPTKSRSNACEHWSVHLPYSYSFARERCQVCVCVCMWCVCVHMCDCISVSVDVEHFDAYQIADFSIRLELNEMRGIWTGSSLKTNGRKRTGEICRSGKKSRSASCGIWDWKTRQECASAGAVANTLGEAYVLAGGVRVQGLGVWVQCSGLRTQVVFLGANSGTNQTLCLIPHCFDPRTLACLCALKPIHRYRLALSQKPLHRVLGSIEESSIPQHELYGCYFDSPVSRPFETRCAAHVSHLHTPIAFCHVKHTYKSL